MSDVEHVCGTCRNFDEIMYADKRRPCELRKRAVMEGYCVVWKPRGTVQSKKPSTDTEGKGTRGRVENQQITGSTK